VTRSVVSLLIVILLFCVSIVFLREEAGPLVRTRLLMGTVVEIRILDEDAADFDEAVSAAFSAMAGVEAMMSPHLSDSEISRLSAAEKRLSVSAETREVIQRSLDISAASQGAFDISIGQLIHLWGFAEGEPQRPERKLIEETLAETGPDALAVSGTEIIKRSSDIAVDLGGVAKGFAIDRAIGVLAAAGVRHASVNAGGDMRLLGDRGGGVKWRIGIQHPRRPQQILARLDLADVAVVTSGDYERYFEEEGVRYHHILDPRSGYPADACQAVTVVAVDALTADALATAVFVLGTERGLALLNSSGVEGMIVDQNGQVEMTSGLKEIISWP